VEAARDLFYHQGYDATSYADIAEQTGLGKGNIHYYFNAKEALLTAVAEHRLERIRRLLEEWTLDCGTPYDCLERFIAMFEENADDLSEYGCPMGTLNDELGKKHRELQDSTRAMFDLFLRWLEARFRAFEAKNKAKAHAEHLMIMAQGISVVAHSYQDPELVRRQAKALRHWLSTVCENK
jgi:AcrR family transcriptional regulator